MLYELDEEPDAIYTSPIMTFEQANLELERIIRTLNQEGRKLSYEYVSLSIPRWYYHVSNSTVCLQNGNNSGAYHLSVNIYSPSKEEAQTLLEKILKESEMPKNE